MIDDVYVEQFVKREKTAMNAVFTVLSIAITFVIIVFINIVPILFGLNIIFVTGIISIGIGVLCWFINRKQNIEYEVSVTNDIFTVTRIIAESKRELLADFNLRECERIAPVTSDNFEEDKSKATFVLNSTKYRQYEVTDSNWYCLVSTEGVRFVVVFEFNPKMYKAFRRYNPRNTFFISPADLEKLNEHS